MEITCPNCARRYSVEPKEISADVTTAECAECGQSIDLSDILVTPLKLRAATPMQPSPAESAARAKPRARRRGFVWGIAGLLLGCILGLGMTRLPAMQNSLAKIWPPTVAAGDTVAIQLSARLPDGRIVDTTRAGLPRRFSIGTGKVIGAFERSLYGMSPGEERRFTLTAEQAHGVHDRSKILRMPLASIRNKETLRVGGTMQLRQDDDSVVPGRITSIADDHVIVDTNHPLAGQTITYDVTLVRLTKRIQYGKSGGLVDDDPTIQQMP